MFKKKKIKNPYIFLLHRFLVRMLEVGPNIWEIYSSFEFKTSFGIFILRHHASNVVMCILDGTQNWPRCEYMVSFWKLQQYSLRESDILSMDL